MNIRQATYDDKPAIFEFLKLAYPKRWAFKFPHRWSWAYEDNPFLAGDRPPVWIAEAPDGRVVGQSAALVEPLVVEGREVRVGWGVDFHVLPEYRGQGLGTQLQASNNGSQEAFMSLSMAPGAARIKEKLGLQPLPPVTLYERILRHGPESVRSTLAARYNRIPESLHRWLSPTIARLLTRRDRLKSPPAEPPGVSIRREPRFNEAFDRLWEKVGPAFHALIRRDAGYLTWKYRRQPHMQHEILGAYRAGELAGYLVLRRYRPPERDEGLLVDLFTHPEDGKAAGALLRHGMWRLFEQGAKVLRAATGTPAFAARLLALGFKARKSVTPLARIPGPVPGDGWLLGKGDHDWDQYPLG